MRRERRTSGRSTTKSISTKNAERRFGGGCGRLLVLPREVCAVSRERLRRSKGHLTAAQKSAEGIVPAGAGKARTDRERVGGGPHGR